MSCLQFRSRLRLSWPSLCEGQSPLCHLKGQNSAACLRPAILADSRNWLPRVLLSVSYDMHACVFHCGTLHSVMG